MAYEIILKPSAQKDLDSLPNNELIRISHRLSFLKNNPRPVGIQKLSDQEGYRVRSGRYRILFEIDDRNKKILVYRIKHRKEAYR